MSHEIYIYQYSKNGVSKEIKEAFEKGIPINDFKEIPWMKGNLVWCLKSMACRLALSKLPFLKGMEVYECNREFALSKEDLISFKDNIENLDFQGAYLSKYIKAQLEKLSDLTETHNFETHYLTLHGDSGVVQLDQEMRSTPYLGSTFIDEPMPDIFEVTLVVFNRPDANGQCRQLKDGDEKKWEDNYKGCVSMQGKKLKEFKWVKDPDGTVTLIGVCK